MNPDVAPAQRKTLPKLADPIYELSRPESSSGLGGRFMEDWHCGCLVTKLAFPHTQSKNVVSTCSLGWTDSLSVGTVNAVWPLPVASATWYVMRRRGSDCARSPLPPLPLLHMFCIWACGCGGSIDQMNTIMIMKMPAPEVIEQVQTYFPIVPCSAMHWQRRCTWRQPQCETQVRAPVLSAGLLYVTMYGCRR